MHKIELETFLEKRPYLAFRLSHDTSERVFTFPKVTIQSKEGAKVIFVDGVLRSFSSLQAFLNEGGHLVFVEKNLAKIRSFLSLPEFPFDAKIDIILPEEEQYKEISWKTLFQKAQFVGSLNDLKVVIDTVHMIASDYRDFGYRILGNIQANLLHTNVYLDGRELKDIFKGVPAIVCGSGPSLEDNYDWLRTIGDKALVIAAGSSVPKLAANGVKIHFGVFIDPHPPLDIYKEIKDFSFPIFYQNRVCRDLFALHQGPKIWMGSSEGWELEQWLYRELDIPNWFFDAGWNAGNFALHIAHYMGCQPYLVGMCGGDRRDLHYGKEWNKNIPTLSERPQLDIPYSLELPNVFGAVDQELLQKACQKIIGDDLQDALDRYLHKPSKKAEILLDAELINHPVYDYWLEPLWKIFKYLYPAEKESVMRAVFFRDVLKKAPKNTYRKGEIFYFQGKKEGRVERYYPSGPLYAIENYRNGERHGEWLTFYESSELKSRVNYDRGMLHGEFHLYFKRGKKREGIYEKGKKVGLHRLWNEDGTLILEAEFANGKPKGTYQRFHDKGHLIEKVVYHPDDRFDKWLFNIDGSLKYEGLFKDDHFKEMKYDKGTVVHTREGKWKEGKVVWT